MNALVPLPVRAAPVSHVSRGAIAQGAAGAFEAASAELFTAHDSRVEKVALIVDEGSPWVVRRGAPLPIIVGRYETQEEADCASLGANHAQVSRTPAALLAPLEVAEAA
jgi:hypothetical protein